MTFKQNPLLLKLSDSARERVQEMIAEEQDNAFLRIWIQGGGCSGMKYGFDLSTEETARDLSFKEEGIRILIDAISASYLQNCVIDYIDDFQGSKFIIENPNASATCGCGESFSY